MMVTGGTARGLAHAGGLAHADGVTTTALP
jgi:hypothetical protein